VHALGGGSRLTGALLGTRIGQDFAHNDFWESVIRFFVTNPLLDRQHVGPIIDYLYAQKFETREVIAGPGRVEVHAPPQPGLTMRGRTAQSLLAQVERWHRELGRASGAERLYFRRSGVKELSLKTGKDGENKWRIRELLSGADLVAEGRLMKHCVASYARSCASGHCSIWTMELVTKAGVEKRQTVEVTHERVIVQCRGKQNRLPTPSEFDVIREWARFAGLTLSPYVRASG
jgi:PcfJ-like protein